MKINAEYTAVFQPDKVRSQKRRQIGLTGINVGSGARADDCYAPSFDCGRRDAHADDVDAGERDAGRGCGDGTAQRTDGYIAHARIARG